ncbi:RMD1 family protein [Thiomicrorhabdus lithotrophica]|uniref:RMD1 family protein n=1 Tax=Thiomicrorhabdus lithotrophica TaxID=2949997 RepID=A0ABY8CEY2_9GAMM|nr:RMD1 family protein [Thiomicrorhabdus lithotrophica]WEJ62983.1 RMD1 family protein [Thiomicrorhabdus lithotrophica]
MSTQSVTLISIDMPDLLSRIKITKALNIQFSKGIEACYYAELSGSRYLFFTEFSVLTFVNWSHSQIVETLALLGIKNAEQFKEEVLHQDYLIMEDANVSQGSAVSNDLITLSELSLWPLMIVALVVSQSVGLERFEEKVNHYFSEGRDMLKDAGRLTWLKRHKFADYAEEISLLRHDMVLDLRLLDKPNVLWDNENYEHLYNRLAEALDLNDRFEVVSYKLNTLKEDIGMMMDLYNHKHSSFLEWIIIWLIVAEVVMSLLGIFGVVEH